MDQTGNTMPAPVAERLPRRHDVAAGVRLSFEALERFFGTGSPERREPGNEYEEAQLQQQEIDGSHMEMDGQRGDFHDDVDYPGRYVTAFDPIEPTPVQAQVTTDDYDIQDAPLFQDALPRSSEHTEQDLPAVTDAETSTSSPPTVASAEPVASSEPVSGDLDDDDHAVATYFPWLGDSMQDICRPRAPHLLCSYETHIARWIWSRGPLPGPAPDVPLVPPVQVRKRARAGEAVGRGRGRGGGRGRGQEGAEGVGGEGVAAEGVAEGAAVEEVVGEEVAAPVRGGRRPRQRRRVGDIQPEDGDGDEAEAEAAPLDPVCSITLI